MIIGCAATFQCKPGPGPACTALKPQPSGAPMKTDYSLAQKALHWTTVLLIIGLWWTSRAVLRTHEIHLIGHHVDPGDLFQHKLHVYGGVLMLGLVAARLALRFWTGTPPLPPAIPVWSAKSAEIAYVLIYSTLIGLTITGGVTTYFWFGMGVAHRALVYGLYALITLHVCAVFLHDIVHRAGLLRRMLPGRQSNGTFAQRQKPANL